MSDARTEAPLGPQRAVLPRAAGYLITSETDDGASHYYYCSPVALTDARQKLLNAFCRGRIVRIVQL